MLETKVKKWLAIDVVAGADAADAVEYALNSLDALGTEIDYMRNPAGENLKVTGYFHKLPDTTLLGHEIDVGLKIYGLPPQSIYTVTTREVRDADWLAEWKRHWKPTQIGKFIIAPPWSEVEKSDKIVIRIEPNMAFGTGTHETTQLCLKAIGENCRDGRSFLDVGTGTGILAIAAAKLSKTSSITACDTDADAVKIAKDNAIANGVGDRIEFCDGSISDSTPVFDFVCANLTIDVILPILPILLEKSRSVLLLSGILDLQEKLIVDALLNFQRTDFAIDQSGEWISVLVRPR